MIGRVTAQPEARTRIVIVTPEGRRYDLGFAPSRIKWLWPRMWLYRAWHLPRRKRARKVA